MKLSIESVDTKKLLRIAWIIESIWFFILVSIILFWKPERTDALVALSPWLFGLIMGQGAVSWSGSNIKRMTKGWLEKAKNGGGNA
jgi:uncharacterized membrane protein YbhN (UPF0104 family)